MQLTFNADARKIKKNSKKSDFDATMVTDDSEQTGRHANRKEVDFPKIHHKYANPLGNTFN